MRSSLSSASFAIAVLASSAASATCTRPVGSFVGADTQVIYTAGSGAVDNALNDIVSLTVNANFSGKFVVKSVSMGSTAVVSTSATFAATANTFDATTCTGKITVKLGGVNRSALYTSAGGGTVMNVVFVPNTAAHFSSSTIRLEKQ